MALAAFDIDRESRLLDREKPYMELIDGIEVRKAMPLTRHGMLQGEMYAILRLYAERRGIAGPEIRIWLTIGSIPTSLVPDVAFISSERLVGLTDSEQDRPSFAPDIAVEIRSPSDRARNISRKIELYLAHGSRLVLDVDPAKRKIFAHDGESVCRYGIGDTFVHDRFADLTFDVRAFFASADIRRR